MLSRNKKSSQRKQNMAIEQKPTLSGPHREKIVINRNNGPQGTDSKKAQDSKAVDLKKDDPSIPPNSPLALSPGARAETAQPITRDPRWAAYQAKKNDAPDDNTSATEARSISIPSDLDPESLELANGPHPAAFLEKIGGEPPSDAVVLRPKSLGKTQPGPNNRSIPESPERQAASKLAHKETKY